MEGICGLNNILQTSTEMCFNVNLNNSSLAPYCFTCLIPTGSQQQRLASPVHYQRITCLLYFALTERYSPHTVLAEEAKVNTFKAHF